MHERDEGLTGDVASQDGDVGSVEPGGVHELAEADVGAVNIGRDEQAESRPAPGRAPAVPDEAHAPSTEPVSGKDWFRSAAVGVSR